MSLPQDSQPTAIPFVYLHNDQFIVSQEAKSFLSQIKTPIAVLTIVGKYRTGKSLFLNRIMLGKSKAFKVSPTINSCTRGLWLWKDTLKFKNEEQDKEVLIIDTEGFGATEESDAYNNKILLFALLLSSYFVYNSVGSIDQNSLNNISVLANLANEIQSKNAKDQNIEQNFPSFLWLVRDFTLHLVDKNDIPIQAKEYLQQALEIQKGTSNLIEGKNRIRRMMKHFFRDRDCFTLVRPVETEDKLQQLDTLEEQDFRSTFLDQSRALKQKILTKIKPKKLKSTLLTGQTFYQLAQNYVDVINSNSLPNFQNSYKHLLKLQIQNLKRAICQQQQTIIKTLLTSSITSLTSYQNLQTLKHSHISSIQSLTKQKVKSHHSLSAFVNSQQIIVLVNEIKSMVGGMFDKCYNTMRQQMRFRYISVMDQIREDKIMSRPLQSIFTQKQLKQFMTHLQTTLTSKLSTIPHFILTQLSTELFIPFKQQLLDQFNQLNSRRLHQSNHQLKIKLQMREETLKHKQEYIQKLEIQLKQSHKSESQLQMKLVLMERDLVATKEAKIQSVHQFQQTINNLQRLNDQVNSELLEVRKQLQIRNQEIIQLNNLLQKSAHEYSIIGKDLAIHKQRLQTKTKQLTQKSLIIQQLSHQNQHKSSQLTDLTQKITQLTQSKQSLYQKFLTTSQQQSQRLIQAQTLTTKQFTELTQLKRHLQHLSSHHQQQLTHLKQLITKQSLTTQHLTHTNNNLQQTINQLQHLLTHFYSKQQSYKQFKKCIKNSSSIQCLHCTRFFMSSIFLTHLSVCTVFNQKEEIALTGGVVGDKTEEEGVRFRVVNVAVHENGSKPLTIYELQCQKGQKKWIIEKKFTDFCEFHQHLQSSLPGVELSSAKAIFDPKYLSKKSLSIQQKQQLIQKYFNDLGQNPSISHNKFWLQFIAQKSLSQPTDPTTATHPQKRIALKQLKQSSSQLNYQMRKSQIRDQNSKPISYHHHHQQHRRESLHTPQEFFKIWQQKQLRSKQSSSVCLKRAVNQ